MMAKLSSPICEASVQLEPLDHHHIEALRDACSQDTEIWDIYPLSFLGEHFDASMKIFWSNDEWVNFAVLNHDIVIGMSHYIRPDMTAKTVEIGETYIVPSTRGTGVNSIMKKLMINHAFECGFEKIGFRVDSRNKRSQAAVRKLGAKHKDTLTQNLTTWTGYVRDTMVFELQKGNWEA